MKLNKSMIGFLVLLPAAGQNGSSDRVEPNAGNWKTWVISSGRDFRVPPPPDAATTRAEIAWLKNFSSESDRRIEQQIRFWDAGPPVYRWIDIITTRALSGLPVVQPRAYAYVALAAYDATVAAWESKYTYSRPGPVKPTLP